MYTIKSSASPPKESSVHNNKEKVEQGSIDSEVIAGAQPVARETLEGGQSEEAYGP